MGGDGSRGVSIESMWSFTNRGTISADLANGVGGSTTGLFYFGGGAGAVVYNYGLIYGTRAIGGSGADAHADFYNFGRLEGSINLEQQPLPL